MSRIDDWYGEADEIMQYFEYGHLPEGLQDVSKNFHFLAKKMLDEYPGRKETLVTLRKLLEARDAAVRAAL